VLLAPERFLATRAASIGAAVPYHVVVKRAA